MALAGIAMGSDFTSSITTGNKSDNGNYYGCTFELRDTFVATTPTLSTEPTIHVHLTLDSITFYTRTSGSQENKTAYLALYEYTTDFTTGTFVALSENTVTANTLNSALTFNFEDVIIDTTKQYQMLFVDTASTAENVASFEGYQAHGTSVGINVLQQSKLPGGDGTYKGTGINSWEGSYIPKVTVKTSNIPEPTTATLSLLALAGLAARRRRR